MLEYLNDETQHNDKNLEEKLDQLLELENQKNEEKLLNNNIEMKSYTMKKELKKQT